MLLSEVAPYILLIFCSQLTYTKIFQQYYGLREHYRDYITVGTMWLCLGVVFINSFLALNISQIIVDDVAISTAKMLVNTFFVCIALYLNCAIHIVYHTFRP